jgi:hypothetical protein
LKASHPSSAHFTRAGYFATPRRPPRPQNVFVTVDRAAEDTISVNAATVFSASPTV